MPPTAWSRTRCRSCCRPAMATSGSAPRPGSSGSTASASRPSTGTTHPRCSITTSGPLPRATMARSGSARSPAGSFAIATATSAHSVATTGCPTRRSTRCMSIAPATLWVGTFGAGLARWAGTRFEVIDRARGLAHDHVRSIFEDRDGVMWVGTDGGGVSRIVQRTRRAGRRGCPGSRRRWSGPSPRTGAGAMWFGTYADGLYRLDRGTLSHLRQRRRPAVRQRLGVARGSRRESLGRHERWSGTPGPRVASPRSISSTARRGMPIRSLYEDRDGALWIGGYGVGLSRLHRRRLHADRHGGRPLGRPRLRAARGSAGHRVGRHRRRRPQPHCTGRRSAHVHAP